MADEQQNDIQQQNQSNDPQGRVPAGGREDENIDTSAIYLGDSKLQSEEEFNLDKNTDRSGDDDKITSSGFDDFESNSDGAAGTDRAGTAERKTYDGEELNEGMAGQDEAE